MPGWLTACFHYRSIISPLYITDRYAMHPMLWSISGLVTSSSIQWVGSDGASSYNEGMCCLSLSYTRAQGKTEDQRK